MREKIHRLDVFIYSIIALIFFLVCIGIFPSIGINKKTEQPKPSNASGLESQTTTGTVISIQTEGTVVPITDIQFTPAQANPGEERKFIFTPGDKDDPAIDISAVYKIQSFIDSLTPDNSPLK